MLRAALRLAKQWKLLTVHPLGRPEAVQARSGRDRCATSRPPKTSGLRAALVARDDTRRADRERANAWRRERGYAEWPVYSTYTDHLTPIVLLALNTGMRRGELLALSRATST